MTNVKREPKRLQIRLGPEATAAVESCAKRSGLSVGAFARLVLEDAVANNPERVTQALGASGGSADPLQAVAGLVAIEHVLGFLEALFPESIARSASARMRAFQAADDRLAHVRRYLERVST